MSRMIGWCVRSRCLRIVLLLAVFLGATAFDVPDLVITERRELRFGGLERSNIVRIAYTDDNSGEFVVEGRAGRKVRLSVETVDLVNPKNTRYSQLRLDLANNQCAFSLDNGRSWAPFTSGPLYQDTQFPAAAHGARTSSVLVRVGGTVTAARTQERGPYNGNIRLTAAYTANDDPDGYCTHSHGYWKNHGNLWPTGYSPGSIWLGGGTFCWLDMLTRPARGDANIILGYQYIAAVLNLARGCDGSTTVTVEGGSTISIQDIVDACSDHYSNRRRLTDTSCREYARILDDYNNGRIGPRHCD